MGNHAHNGRSEGSNGDRSEQLEAVVSRLGTAGIDYKRFIDVADGQKQSFNHSRRRPEVVSGNYGVYCGRGLLGIDIDDFEAWEEAPGTDTLENSFTVATPHDGEHRYYRAEDDTEWAIIAATGGPQSVSLPWGELYMSKYLVGPGSEITTCNRSGCFSCTEDDPGRYEIVADRPIETISTDSVVELLEGASVTARKRQASMAEFGESIPVPANPGETEPNSRSQSRKASLQIQLGEEKPEDPDKRILWGIVSSEAGSQPEDGAVYAEIVDLAGEAGIDCILTGEIIRSWLNSGVLRRSRDPNRIIQRERRER